jgi:hypothetical protein
LRLDWPLFTDVLQEELTASVFRVDEKDTLTMKAAKTCEISVINCKSNQRHVSRNSDFVSIRIKMCKMFFFIRNQIMGF